MDKRIIITVWKKLIVCLLVCSLILQDVRPLAAVVRTEDLVIPTVTTTVSVNHGTGTGVTKLSEGRYIISNHAEADVIVSMQVQNLQKKSRLKGVYSGIEFGYIQDEDTTEIGEEDKGFGAIIGAVSENNDIWVDRKFQEEHPESEELTDPGRWYKSTLRLDYKAEYLTNSTSAKIYSYKVRVKFDTGTKENATINLKSFAGYQQFDLGNGITHDNNGKGYTSTPSENSIVQLVNSNLEWEFKATPLTGAKRDQTAPTLWKEYNYQDILVNMKNVSKSDAAYMDEFECIFNFPYDNGLNGVKNEHMTAWIYDPDNPDEPKKNQDTKVLDNDSEEKPIKYVGKYNQGGVLVYDVTELTDEQIKNYEGLGASLPYLYTGQGIVSIIIDKDHGGTLVAPGKSEKDKKLHSSRRLLIRVPMANNFEFNGQDYVALTTRKVYSTVRFGTPIVELSREEGSILQYFKKQAMDGSVEKTTIEDEAYIGKEAGYTIANATNKGNLPMFEPKVEDTLPAYFDLTRLEYYLSNSDLKKMGEDTFPFIMNQEKTIELAFKNKKQEIIWVDTGKKWVKQKGEKESGEVWGIEGLDSFLENYLKEEEHKGETFARKIRIHYGYKFDPITLKGLEEGETILGQLRVYGIPQKAVSFENKAELWFDYYLFNEKGQENHGWNHQYVGPYRAKALALGVPPALWSMTQAFYDDGEEKREGDETVGIAKSIVNGYRVRFGSGNDSLLYGGKVEIEIPHMTTTPSEYLGFDTEEIKLTKELLNNAPVDTIFVEWYNKKVSKYSLDRWEVDKEGNYVLQKEKFPYDIVKEKVDGKEIEKKIPYIPTKIILKLEQIKSNTKKPENVLEDKAYVQVLGSYPYPGSLILKTTVTSDYQDGIQQELEHRSEAKLIFLKPVLLPKVNGIFDNGKTEQYEEGETVHGILNKPYGGYRFYTEIQDAPLAPGALKLELPYQFFSNKIIISQKLIADMIDDQGEVSWKELQIIGSKGTVIVYNKEELNQWKTDTDLIITEQQWKEKGGFAEEEYIKTIKLSFKNLKITKDKAGYLGVDGTAKVTRSNKATGTAYTDFPRGVGEIIEEQAEGFIEIDDPNLQILVQAFSEEEKRIEDKSINGIKWEDKVGFTYRIGSTNTSRIEPGVLSIELPMLSAEEKGSYKDEDGQLQQDKIEDVLKDPKFTSRFTATELVIKKEMLNQMKLTSVKIVNLSGEETLITATELGIEWKAENDSEYKTFDRDIILSKDKWKGTARFIYVYFDYYKESVSMLSKTSVKDNAYVQVRGAIKGEGQFISEGTVATNYLMMPGYNVSKKDNATIVIKETTPWVYVNAFREKMNDIRNEAKEMEAGKHEDCAGYRYYFGLETESRFEPGVLTMALPMMDQTQEDAQRDSFGKLPDEFTKESLAQGAFVATKLVIKKEFLDTIKITGIKIVSNEGKETVLQQQDFTPDNVEDDIVIPSSKWEGIAYKVILLFEYQKSRKEKPATPEKMLEEPYVQIQGIAKKEGTLIGRGKVVNDFEANQGVQQKVDEDEAKLKIETPTIVVETLAHVTKENNTNPVKEQHNTEIHVPIESNTYYTYELKVQSKYSIIKDSKITMELNNKIRKTDNQPHGFLPEKLVIPSTYQQFFMKETIDGDDSGLQNGITKIVVKDTVKQGEKQKEYEFTMKDFSKDEEGNYYLPSSKWKGKIQYPSQFVIFLHGISAKEEKTDSLLLTLYGKADWYTYIDDELEEKENIEWSEKQEFNKEKWIKLDTTMVFQSLDLDSYSFDDKAYQDVPMPRVSLSADFNNYYEHQQGKESIAKSDERGIYNNSGVRKLMYAEELWDIQAYESLDDRSYLAVPYEKNVTTRFSLFQDSISTAAEFVAKLTLPIQSSKAEKEPNRGFHALELVIEKQMLDEAYFKKPEIALRDIEAMNEAEEAEWEIVLTPQNDSQTFQVQKVWFNTEKKDTLNDKISVDKNGNLMITRKQWESWGISSLAEVEIRGEDFITRSKNEAGDILITGFSDSDFANEAELNTKVLYSKKEEFAYKYEKPKENNYTFDGDTIHLNTVNGFHNIIRTKADTILKGQKEKPIKEKMFARIRDEARLFISKMFFDVQVETGYIRQRDVEKNKDLRYTQTGISKEHIRSGNVEGDRNHYADVGSLLVGYKSLVSISVDVRQFLNDYVVGKPHMPNDAKNGHKTWYFIEGVGDYKAIDIAKDYNQKNYVKNYAYNTKADVKVEVELPVDKGYEAYYLKIDPRAVTGEQGQQYIDSITLIRKNGETEEIKGSQLVKNSSKWNAAQTDKQWYRINLLTLEKQKRFVEEDSYKEVNGTNSYYRSPAEDWQETTAIKKVIFHLKINQNDSHDGKTAAKPDFGTWVQDTEDMEQQHMFEFVGRANQIGTMTAKATATIQIGDRTIHDTSEKNENPVRITTPMEGKKTGWSLNTYYGKHKTSGSTNGTLAAYTAADLVSKAEVIVGENKKIAVDQHIEDSKKPTERLDYIFGTEHPYDMQFWTTQKFASAHYVTFYYVSYVDQMIVKNTLPPLTKMEDGQYWGFKPTKYIVKSELFDKETAFVLTDTTGKEVFTLTNDTIKEYPKCDQNGKVDGEGEKSYYQIPIFYQENQDKKDNQGIGITLEEGQYLANAQLRIYNIDGDGDYASEIHGRKQNTFFDKTAAETKIDWFKAYGEVNVLYGDEKNDKKLDGVSQLVCEIQNKGAQQEEAVQATTEDEEDVKKATMKAYLVPLELKSTVTAVEETKKYWDYHITKNQNGTDVAVDPMSTAYSINFSNSGRTDYTTSMGEKYEASNITKLAFTQPLPEQFRLSKIKIPAVLFKGTKESGGISNASAFSIVDGTQESVNVLQYFHEDETKENYVLDVKQLYTDGILTRTEKTYKDAVQKDLVYAAEQSVSFSAVFGFLEPLKATQSWFTGDDIIFEGTWVDQTKDAVEEKQPYDEYNTIPTLGKKRYTYTYENYETVTMPFRTDFIVESDTFGHNNLNNSKLEDETQNKEINTSCDVKVYNRISEFAYEQRRGSIVQVKDETGQWVDKETLAYDVDRQERGIKTLPVKNKKLYSGDQIEYRLTVKTPEDKKSSYGSIPIKNPKIEFEAPVGSRIVGWKFDTGVSNDAQVGTKEQITDASALEALAYTTAKTDGVVLENGKEYRFYNKQKTNYKHLSIHTKQDRYVPLGGYYRVIVYVEMLQEDEVGKSITETVKIATEFQHNYFNYFADWYYNSYSQNNVKDIDETVGGKVKYEQNSFLNEQQKQPMILITSELDYYSWQKPTISLSYTNKDGEQLDEQEVVIKVGNTNNQSEHFNDFIIYDVDFIKTLSDGRKQQYVQLSKKPVILYEVSKPEIPNIEDQAQVLSKAGITIETDKEGKTHYYKTAKLFYQTTITEDMMWLPLEEQLLQDKEEIELLKTITRLRWVYEEVPAYVNDDGVTYPSVKNIEIYGTANWQDERTEAQKAHTKASEYVSMPVTLHGVGIHKHEKEPEDTTSLECDNRTEARVFRGKPRVSMAIQAMELDQDLTTLEPMSEGKRTYRPTEELLYRLTVRNEKAKVEWKQITGNKGLEYINTGTGPLLDPVIYDKVPTQYMDVVSGFAIYVVDETAQGESNKEKTFTETGRRQLSDDEVKQIVSKVGFEANDYYGSYYTDGTTYNPENEDEASISYTMYRFDFSKLGFRLERGQRLEIVYKVKIHEKGLPLKKKEKYGRIAYTQALNKSRHLYPDLMDEDNIVHDIALTAKRNRGTDPLEFLNGSKVKMGKRKLILAMKNEEDHLQRPSIDSQYIYNTYYIYSLPIIDEQFYQSGRYLANEYKKWGKSFYTLMKDRIAHTSNFDPLCEKDFAFAEEEDRNLIWAENKLHLPKGWLGNATEIVGNEDDFYYESNKNIVKYKFEPYNALKGSPYEYWCDDYPFLDNKTSAIEWKENVTARLYAVNYGDEVIDGVQFTYVFPKGIRPIIKDGEIDFTVRQYDASLKKNTQHQDSNSVEMTDAKDWKVIDKPKITWELLQDPSTEKKTTPSYTLVDERRNKEGEKRYAQEDIEECYVLQITLDETLQKYWGNENGDYILAVDIPAYVYEMTESGNWYDRLYTAPIDKASNSYCQIYDTSYQINKIYYEVKWNGSKSYFTGKSWERYDLDIGGPEDAYMSSHYLNTNTTYANLNVMPPGMYLQGYNAQPNYVMASEDPNILVEKNQHLKNLTDTREYAQVGTVVTMKKPFLRQWADPGDADGNPVSDTRYLYEEEDLTQILTMNLNVENRYYAAEYQKETRAERNFIYNLEEGGVRGTYFDPVLTVVLPYGFMPLNKEKELFSKEENENPTNGINGTTDSIYWEMKVSQWNGNENKQGDKQNPEVVSVEQLKRQNLLKESFDVQVDFDKVAKQYVLRFIPKSTKDNDVVELLNQQLLRISFQMVSYDAQKYGPSGGKNKFYPDAIQTYISSRMKSFSFTSDDLVEKNRGDKRYQVLAEKGTSDPRRDSTTKEDGSVEGYLTPYRSPDENDNKKSYPTGLLRFNEIEMAEKKPVGILVREEDGKEYADLNNNHQYVGDLKYAETLLKEQMLVNTLRIFAKDASFTSEARISSTKDGEGVLLEDSTTPKLSTPFDYSDDVWYSIKLSNYHTGKEDIRKTGNIRHATYVAQVYLPKELRYDDTFASSEDDKYAEYYIEMIDNTGDEPVVKKIEQQELEQQGWKVQIKAIDEGGHIVRALIIPAGDQKGRPAGLLKYKESIVLHFKARVAEMEAPTDEMTWTVDENTQVFASVYGLDGAELDFMTLKPVEGKDAPYTRQSTDRIQFSNRLSSEMIGKPNNPLPVEEEEEEQKFTYDKTVGFIINQPKYDRVRTNTERIRRVFEPEPITGEIPSRDAVFKQSEAQNLLINEAGLSHGSVQKFVLQYDIPYRSHLEISTNRADRTGVNIKIGIDAVTTGVWEIPDNAKHRDELEKNLRVYVYMKKGNEEQTYQYFDQKDSEEENNEWTLLNPEGARIDENVAVDLSSYDQTNVRQIRWVIQHKEDPIHYPVPKGIRLDIDADAVQPGKQSVFDVDPATPYLGEGLHGKKFVQNVLDHSIQILVEAETIESEEKNQWVNYYVSPASTYTDTKKHSLDKTNYYRAGYEIVPELPYIDMFLRTQYLRKVGKHKFEWSPVLFYDLVESKIVKHKVTLLDADQALMEKYGVEGEEDIVTRPEIMVALPLREALEKEEMVYIPYEVYQAEDKGDNGSKPKFHLQRMRILSGASIEKEMAQDTDKEEVKEKETSIQDTILDDTYTTSTYPIEAESKMPWTAYVEDADGNKYPLQDPDDGTISQIQTYLRGDVEVTDAYIGEETGRTVVTFRFNGKLKPGQRLIVEFLSKVEEGLKPPSTIDFQIKAWATKYGAFLPSLLPKEAEKNEDTETTTPSNVGVIADRYDLNANNNINELCLVLEEGCGGIQGTQGLIVQKYVSTDLNNSNKASTVPIPVQEGGIYTFTLGAQSTNVMEKSDYMAPIIFDILPYRGDRQIVGSHSENGELKAAQRNSMWNGWLIPESIKIWAVDRASDDSLELTERVMDSSQYDVFVGPIQKTEDGYVLKQNADGTPILPSLEERSSSKFYADINANGENSTHIKGQFVKLSDLMDENPNNYEELIKGIRMVLVRFKAPKDIVLYGQGSYKLEYKMKAPLSSQIFVGDLKNPAEYEKYPSWNTGVVAVTPYNVSTDISNNSTSYEVQESNPSGVYVQAPEKRGYLGDYVWHDYNANGKQDEGYYDRIVDGKRHVFSGAAIDLNGDGVINDEDDPGVDRVKVELLTQNGYPSNVNGQAVVQGPKEGFYYIIDETTGQYKYNVDGIRITTNKGPEVTYTTKDYYGSKGYYIFSNLKPGQYKVRFTLPEEYKSFVLTTPTVLGKEVKAYMPGEQLPSLLVPADITEDKMSGNGTIVTTPTFVTDTISVEAMDTSSEEAELAYDQRATLVDIGIANPVRYGGSVWDDNSSTQIEAYQLNGRRDEIEDGKKEEGIAGITIRAYEAGKEEVAIGMDRKPLITTTNENGDYEFAYLYPNREYYFELESKMKDGKIYRATPIQPNPGKPLLEDEDNDGKEEVKDGTYVIQTGVFQAMYPVDETGKTLYEEDGSGRLRLNSNIDFGLIQAKQEVGLLGDYVWIDSNHNGIQDRGEEPYKDGLVIRLEEWYYDPYAKEWKELEGKQKEVVSDEHGYYLFKKLPTSITLYYDAEGNQVKKKAKDAKKTTCILGYRPYVEQIPPLYTMTLTEVGNNKEIDSNLNEKGYLVNEGEFVILAKEVEGEVPVETKTSVFVLEDGKQVVKYYDPSQAEYRLDYDIGLFKLNSGGVSGLVFEDRDYDGLQDPEKDRAIEGVKVYLEALNDGEVDPMTQPTYTDNLGGVTFTSSIKVNEHGFIDTEVVAKEKEVVSKEKNSIKEPMITQDGKYHVVTLSAITMEGEVVSKEAISITDKYGRYEFTDVPLYKVDENGVKQPIRYRIRIEKPINTKLTYKDIHNNLYDVIDSDFALYDKENHPFDSISESFVLGKRLYEDPNKTDAWGNRYDYTKEVFRGHVDAGLLVRPTRVVIGDRVWNDKNQNGIQEDSEYGIENVEVTLYRFNPDAKTLAYVVNDEKQAIGIQTIKGKWEICRDEFGTAQKTKTGQDGRYYFQVQAYNMDKTSTHFLEPYHYRVGIWYPDTGTISPLHATISDSTVDSNKIDSNGWSAADLIDLTVSKTEKQKIQNWIQMQQNKKLPFVPKEPFKLETAQSEEGGASKEEEPRPEEDGASKEEEPRPEEGEASKGEEPRPEEGGASKGEEPRPEEEGGTSKEEPRLEEEIGISKVEEVQPEESISSEIVVGNHVRNKRMLLSLGALQRIKETQEEIVIPKEEENTLEEGTGSLEGEETKPEEGTGSSEGEETKPEEGTGSSEGEETKPEEGTGSSEGEEAKPEEGTGSLEGEEAKPEEGTGSSEGEETKPEEGTGSSEGEETKPEEGTGSSEGEGSNSEEWNVPKFEGTLPYDTPVGNLFGIKPDKNLVISDEFNIANVFVEEKITDNPIELLLRIFHHKWNQDDGKEMSEATCEIVEDSTQYFKLLNMELFQETQKTRKEVAKKMEEYVDFDVIYSDYTIDFGVYDPTLPEPEKPTEPEKPLDPDGGGEKPEEGTDNPDGEGGKPEEGTDNPDGKGEKPEEGTDNPDDGNKLPDKGEKDPNKGDKTSDKGGKFPNKEWKDPNDIFLKKMSNDRINTMNSSIVKTNDNVSLLYTWLSTFFSGNLILYFFFRRSRKKQNSKKNSSEN